MPSIQKKVESFFKKRKRLEESPSFLRNGGVLLEKILALSNGREEIHIKRFTIQEITHSTNNFQELVKEDEYYRLYKGNVEGRPVLVVIWDGRHHDSAIFCTAIAAHMSHLKYILKLIGCCLDFEFPAQVYEYAGKTLNDFLGEVVDVSLSWGNRIKIARDIAGILIYLHTCFPMTIIYKNLKTSNVLIDRNGDAKLFDFSLSIQIPEGELEVKDEAITGTLGFMDPEYLHTGLVTTKTDVYSFGIILLKLLTGLRQPFWPIREYEFIDVNAEQIDPTISEEVGIVEFQAMKDLVLSCTESIAANRPEMINVARILRDIEKQVNKGSSRVVSPLDYNQKALKKKMIDVARILCDIEKLADKVSSRIGSPLDYNQNALKKNWFFQVEDMLTSLSTSFHLKKLSAEQTTFKSILLVSLIMVFVKVVLMMVVQIL